MSRPAYTPALATALFLVLNAGTTCSGEEVARDRYSMSPVDGGMLRLDKDTGAVSFCARKGESWSCSPVEDKGGGGSERIARLEAENKDLKDRIAGLEAKDAAMPPGGKVQIPTEEEVDKALDMAERLFKKFRDRLQRLDPPKDSPPNDGSSSPPEGGRL